MSRKTRIGLIALIVVATAVVIVWERKRHAVTPPVAAVETEATNPLDNDLLVMEEDYAPPKAPETLPNQPLPSPAEEFNSPAPGTPAGSLASKLDKPLPPVAGQLPAVLSGQPPAAVTEPLGAPQEESKVEEAKKEQVHVVKKGDSLYEIARTYYKKPGMWTKIAEANNVKGNTMLKTGQKLVIPAADNHIGVPEPAPLAAPAEKDADKEGTITYVVKSGDTLLKIAKHKLGGAKDVARILKANPGLDGSRIKIGQKIQLPGK